MKARTLSAVAKVMFPPDRNRATNFPSFTAMRPNVLSAIARRAMNSSISRSKALRDSMAAERNGTYPTSQWDLSALPRGRDSWDKTHMVDDADTPLARELRRLMAERDLTPKGLSLAAGLGATYVRDLLKGRSQSPEASKLAKIEDVLGVAAGTLLKASVAPQQAEMVSDAGELLLLITWRQLSEQQRKTALGYLAFLASQAREIDDVIASPPDA